MNRFLNLVVLLLLTACQNQSPASETPEQYLAKVGPKLKFTTSIRSILEDSKGRFWFGSDREGVALLEGNEFTYFTVENGLSDNQVRRIQEDKNGVIWFGTARGINSYDGQKIQYHTIDSTDSKWALTANDLWFNAGKEAGVYRYDGQKLQYLPFSMPERAEAFNSYAATGFTKDQQGKIWIATYMAALGYDGASLTVIDDLSLGYTEETGRLHIRSIFADSKGRLWIGNNGIGVLLKEDESITNFSQNMGLVPMFSSRSGSRSPKGTLEHVFAIEEDSQGNIWFGDRDTGAWKYDGKKMTNYTQKNGLTSDFVPAIYKDKKGELWFGTADGSVMQLVNGWFVKVY